MIRARRGTRAAALVTAVTGLAALTVGLFGPEPALARPAPRDRAPVAGPLLAPLPTDPRLPTRAGLAAALDHLVANKSLGPRVSVAVGDPDTGKLLYAHRAQVPFTPASTTKLLTVTAALSVLGPQHTFATRVFDAGTSSDPSGPAGHRRHSIVLVGGGDPLLASRSGLRRDRTFGRVPYPQPPQLATIGALADETAKALLGKDVRTVSVRYDSSRFGQPVTPHWRKEYIRTSVVSPVSALWVDEGRTQAPYDARAADPARDAATRFAHALRADGVAVSGAPTRGSASAGAPELARVTSPPLRSIVEHILKVSDNDGAEVLARQVAVASHRPADFAGAVAAVEARLRKLGIDLAGVRLYDGSGLSRDDRIPVRVLIQVLDLTLAPEHLELSSIRTDLPIGGFDGSLSNRYVYTSAAAAGYVYAKTGTLTGVSTLAGTVLTRGGAVLTFGVMTDQLTKYALPAIDRIAARVAACGCR